MCRWHENICELNVFTWDGRERSETPRKSSKITFVLNLHKTSVVYSCHKRMFYFLALMRSAVSAARRHRIEADAGGAASCEYKWNQNNPKLVVLEKNADRRDADILRSHIASQRENHNTRTQWYIFLLHTVYIVFSNTVLYFAGSVWTARSRK